MRARRLRSLARLASERGGLRSLLSPSAQPAGELRSLLLATHGIGPETADAILLYAGGRTSFVVDAYTRRILRRHFLLDEDAGYETVRRLFHESVTPSASVYNEYHALLVRLGKEHCRTKAVCEGCPLTGLPHDAQR